MLTKKSQTKRHGRIRDDTPVSFISNDGEYLTWLHYQQYPCFVCGKQNGIEWHHVKRDSTDKKDHKRLIPLCGNEHHRNGKLSPHGNPSLWRETFSMDLQNGYADSIYQDYLREIK